jgi:uncharacterized membrane-anchored protein YitT (DUF2179 family)
MMTFVLHQKFGLEDANSYVLLVDCATLVFAVFLVLKSNAHWPMWFCGFHMIAVATGIAQICFPNGLPANYTDTAGFWALPALGAAVAGVLFDRKLMRQRP